jgi:hypothetical protein
MDLRAESLRLRDLATVPPTPKARDEVTQALSSKWEGVQAVAAEVLGAWGDPLSKNTLREWFMETIHRPLGWAIRSVAVRELARLATGDDARWVLDLYFETDDGLLQHELLRLAAALPAASAMDLVLTKARNANARVRHSALKILVWSSWGEPKDLLRPFAKDPDPLIKKMLIAWGAA